MFQIDDNAYHLERARSEFDLACRASNGAAAAAHAGLAALHMQKVRDDFAVSRARFKILQSRQDCHMESSINPEASALSDRRPAPLTSEQVSQTAAMSN
jgi:hypothetical protein